MNSRMYCISAFFSHRSLLFILFISPFHVLLAQSAYPVQANAFFLSPYSLYLEDYESRNRLAVTLINTDLQYPSLQVRLQIILKAGGLTLTIPPQAYIPPITLTPGIAYRLSPEELAPYFRSMSPSGMGSSAFLKDRKLPQGMVELSVEVQEYFSGRRLSQPRTAFAWISAQKPPLLNLPYKGENLSYREPLNLLFQWAPQHTGLAMVEYELIIKQIWDNGLSPEAAWLYSPVICKESTRFTTLLYGPAMPMLTPGMTYVWAVRAVAKDGLDELRAFENNGLSEIRWFTLEEYCPPPLNLQAHTEKGYIYLEWTPLPEHREFIVSYRRKDLPGADWFSTKTVRSRLVIRDIRPGFMYEYRIGTCCKPGVPVYGPTFSIDVPVPVEEENPNCGVMKPIDLSNKELLPAITAGEMFTAADFPVYILEVNGSDGVFSGRGYQVMSKLFDGIKLEVTFDHIKINTDYRMIDGVVKGVSSPRKEQISNLDTVVETLTNLIDSLASAIKHLDFTIGSEKEIQLKENPEALSDSNASKYIVEVNGVDGEKESLPVNSLPLVVEDGEGNQYEIQKDGAVNTVQCHKISKKNKQLYQFIIDGDTLQSNSVYATFLGKPNESFEIQFIGENLNKEELVWKLKEKAVVQKSESCAFPCGQTGNFELIVYQGKDAIGSISVQIYGKPVFTFRRFMGYDGEFGFDSGSEISESSDYSHLQIGETYYRVPWLGLLPLQTVELSLKSNIPNAKNTILDKNLQIRILSSNPQKIKLNGKESLTFDLNQIKELRSLEIQSDKFIDSVNFNISEYIYILDQKDDTVGKINLYCFKPKEQEIAIIFVKHDKKEYRKDITKEQLLEYVNTHSHNQLFFKFVLNPMYDSIHELDIKGAYEFRIGTINKWDINNLPNWNSINEKVLHILNYTYRIQLNKRKLAYDDKTLFFFITNIDMDNITGSFKEDYGIAYISKKGSIKEACHELGHGVDLIHPFCCMESVDKGSRQCMKWVNGTNRCIGRRNTYSNYMDHINGKEMESYFYYQWKAAQHYFNKNRQ